MALPPHSLLPHIHAFISQAFNVETLLNQLINSSQGLGWSLLYIAGTGELVPYSAATHAASCALLCPRPGTSPYTNAAPLPSLPSLPLPPASRRMLVRSRCSSWSGLPAAAAAAAAVLQQQWCQLTVPWSCCCRQCRLQVGIGCWWGECCLDLGGWT